MIDANAENARLRQFEAAFNEWHRLTAWVQDDFTAGKLPGAGGLHRAVIMRNIIDRQAAEIEALKHDIERHLAIIHEMSNEYICTCGLRVEPHRCRPSDGGF